jgi:hypothetical protein
MGRRIEASEFLTPMVDLCPHPRCYWPNYTYELYYHLPSNVVMVLNSLNLAPWRKVSTPYVYMQEGRMEYTCKHYNPKPSLHK